MANKQYAIRFLLNAGMDSSFNKSFNKASNNMQSMSDRAAKSADNIRGSFTKAATAVGGLFAINKVVNIGKDVVQTYANFEQAMADVQAVSGVAGLEFEALEKKALDMGKATSKSATESAEGLKYLALAGWNVEQQLAGIEPVLRLSEAGTMDLGRASDLATDSMAAMGIGVDGLMGYLDKVAQTSRKANTSVEQLMDAYVVSGGIFKANNVPLEESASLLAVLANRGFKGAEAGTAMNAIVTNLTTPFGRYGKAMKEIGVSAFDAQGNFRGLERTFRDVKAKLDPMTDAQRSQYITMIAGKEHLKTFTGILDGLGAEYDDLKGNVEGADGALMEMAHTQMDTFTGSVTLMQSAIEGFKIELGKKLAPTIRKVADYIANELPGATDKMIANWPKIVERGRSIVKVLAGMVGVVATVKVAKFAGDVANVGKSLGSVARLAPRAVGAIGAFANPVGAVVGAVALLTTGVIAYRRHQEKTRQELINMGGALQNAQNQYQAVADKSELTKQLTEEYRTLDDAVRNNVGTAEELAGKQERMNELTQQLQDMYPQTLTNYDIEKGKMLEKLGIIEQMTEAELELEKLRLEQTVAEKRADQSKLEKEMTNLQSNLTGIEQRKNALDEERAAMDAALPVMMQYEAELRKINNMSNSTEKYGLLEDLVQRAESSDITGRFVQMYGLYEGAYKSLEHDIKRVNSDLSGEIKKQMDTMQELDTAKSSYQELYDAQVRLIELDLGGTVEEQAKKYKELTGEEKIRFDEALASITNINDRLKALPTDHKINVDVVYNESRGLGSAPLASNRPKSNDEKFDDFKRSMFQTPKFDAYADGGFASRPSIFGEAGLEAAVPINNKPRSHSILDKVNRLMGHDTGASGGGEINVTFSPTVNIDGGTPDVARQVQHVMGDELERFKKLFKEMMRDEGRLAFR